MKESTQPSPTNATGYNDDDENGVGVENVVIGIVLLTLTAVTIVGNTIVLLAFALERKLRNTFTYYVANLAVTDLMVGSTAMPFYAFDTMLGYWPFGEVMCAAWIFFDYGMTFASVFSLVAISLDRYWAVIWSVHYRMYNTTKKSAVVIFIVWFLVLAVWLAPFILDRLKWSEPKVCIWEPSRNKEFVIFIAIVGHHLPCVILIYCYVRVFWLTSTLINVAPATQVADAGAPVCSGGIGFSAPHPRTSTALQDPMAQTKVATITFDKSPLTPPLGRNSHSKTPPTAMKRGKSEIPKMDRSQSKDKKVFITLTYITFTYLICWVPFHVIFDICAVDPSLVPASVYTMGFWLAYVNSTLNPVLYAYSSKEFRGAFFKVITGKYCRRK